MIKSVTHHQAASTLPRDHVNFIELPLVSQLQSWLSLTVPELLPQLAHVPSASKQRSTLIEQRSTLTRAVRQESEERWAKLFSPALLLLFEKQNFLLY